MLHLLIRTIALDCGYSSASLSERIYAGTEDDPRTGILIYTAVPDAEGTLGGLVSQAEPDRLVHLTRRALRDATRCSSDPLCAERLPQPHADFLHGAACHVCLFVSETTCERDVIPPVLRAHTASGVPHSEAAAYLRGLAAGHEHATTAVTVEVETVWSGPGSRPPRSPLSPASNSGTGRLRGARRTAPRCTPSSPSPTSEHCWCPARTSPSREWPRTSKPACWYVAAQHPSGQRSISLN